MGGVELPVFLGLLAIAGIAGFVDAVAGGGGLLQLPPLLALFPQAPGVALATNKVSSICGTTAAIARYARNGSVRWRTVAVLGPVAGAASAAGSLSFLEVVKQHGAAVRPVFAACFLALSAHQAWKALSPPAAVPRESRARPALALLFVLAIGVYDGFFGPGAGMFLFWTLTTWLALAPLEATGTTKPINWLTNVGALAVLIPSTAVPWTLALSMAAANVVGGTVGAHTAIRRGVRFIRLTTAVVCIGVCVYLLLP
jgi:uncharacterized protein